MKKIAVLIYGQSRDIDTQTPINSIKFLFPLDKIDFYIHTWADQTIINQEEVLRKKFIPKALKIDTPLNMADLLEKYARHFNECERRLNIKKNDTYKFSILSQLTSIQAVNELFVKNSEIGFYDYIALTRTDVIALGKINDSLLDKFDLLVSMHHSYYPDVIQIYKTSIAEKIKPIDYLEQAFQKTWDISGEAFRETTFRIAGISITYDKFDYRLARDKLNFKLKIKLLRQLLRYLYKKYLKSS